MFGFLKPHIKPLQAPHPPIGVAGLSKGSDTLKLAGETRLHPDEPQPQPGLCRQPLGSRSRSAPPKSGRTPDRGQWRMVREVFVADTDEEAMRLSVGSHMGRMMREYFLPLLAQFGFLEYLKHDPNVADSDVTPEYCAKHNWIVGSPKTVAEKIEKIYDEVGGFGQLLVFGFDYVENPQGLAPLARAAVEGGDAQGAAPQARDGADGCGIDCSLLL